MKQACPASRSLGTPWVLILFASRSGSVGQWPPLNLERLTVQVTTTGTDQIRRPKSTPPLRVTLQRQRRLSARSSREGEESGKHE